MNTTDKKADEYANGMMGIGTYSEQWEWADKYMYNCLKKSYLAGHAAALSSGGSGCIKWKEVSSDKPDKNGWYLVKAPDNRPKAAGRGFYKIGEEWTFTGTPLSYLKDGCRLQWLYENI